MKIKSWQSIPASILGWEPFMSKVQITRRDNIFLFLEHVLASHSMLQRSILVCSEHHHWKMLTQNHMNSTRESVYAILLRVYHGRENHSAWLWNPPSILSYFTHPVYKCSSQIATPASCAKNRNNWPQKTTIKNHPCSQSHKQGLFVAVAADGASVWAVSHQESVITEPGTCKLFPNKDIGRGEMCEMNRTRWLPLIWLTGCSHYYCLFNILTLLYDTHCSCVPRL